MIDLVIGLTLLEWAALAVFHRRTGRGVPGGRLAGNILAGVALLGAVRAALTGAGWWAVAACLLGGLLAHGIDLRQRWSDGPPMPG